MKQRQLGNKGPLVSELGLGCMGMSAFYGERDEAGSQETLLRALDLGITHFDTSDMYGNGHNEELIGRTLGSRRDEFVLATKFAIRTKDDGTPPAYGLGKLATPHFAGLAWRPSISITCTGATRRLRSRKPFRR